MTTVEPQPEQVYADVKTNKPTPEHNFLFEVLPNGDLEVKTWHATAVLHTNGKSLLEFFDSLDAWLHSADIIEAKYRNPEEGPEDGEGWFLRPSLFGVHSKTEKRLDRKWGD